MAYCCIENMVKQALPITSTNRVSPVDVYNCLLDYVRVNSVSLGGTSVEKVWTYLETRSKKESFVHQDLLPLYVYMAISGQSYDQAIPLAAGWTLYLGASHLLDYAQDNGDIQFANASVTALAMANLALIQLQTDSDTLKDILDAFARVSILGANAQDTEQLRGRLLSRTEYFRVIAGKAAAVISTGVWAGGRLTTNDVHVLAVLKEFGLAWGMAIQISDDCVDLADDLSRGLYTLPVIEGLMKSEHFKHKNLRMLLNKTVLSTQEIQMVVDTLNEMGTIALCQQVVRAYHAQAAATFDVIPALAPYFSDHVTLTS